MTTVIACRSTRTMVADSRIVHGDVKFTSRKKIQKVGNYLAGVAGDYGPALTYLKTFEEAALQLDGRSIPRLEPFEQEFELMVLSRHGLWLYSSDGSAMEVEDDYYFIGSGGGFAGAALMTQELLLQSCNLEMALEVACEFDPNSALPLVSLTLGRRVGPKTG